MDYMHPYLSEDEEEEDEFNSKRQTRLMKDFLFGRRMLIPSQILSKKSYRRPNDDNDGDKRDLLHITFLNDELCQVTLGIGNHAAIRFRTWCGGGHNLKCHAALRFLFEGRDYQNHYEDNRDEFVIHHPDWEYRFQYCFPFFSEIPTRSRIKIVRNPKKNRRDLVSLFEKPHIDPPPFEREREHIGRRELSTHTAVSVGPDGDMYYSQLGKTVTYSKQKNGIIFNGLIMLAFAMSLDDTKVPLHKLGY